MDTMPEIYRPLMQCPTIRLGRCAVCGRTYPLEQHHLVWRSQGKLFKEGKELPKPTITLCGFGNNLYDADKRPYCHSPFLARKKTPSHIREGVFCVRALGSRARYAYLLAPQTHQSANMESTIMTRAVSTRTSNRSERAARRTSSNSPSPRR